MHSRLISGSCAKAELEGGGKAKIDRVSELIARKAQAQAHDPFPRCSLNGMLASEHRPRDRLWSGPERGLKAAFTSQRRDDPSLSCLRQQTKRAIEIRFAASVGTRHEIQPLQRNDDLTEGAIAGDGEGREHCRRRCLVRGDVPMILSQSSWSERRCSRLRSHFSFLVVSVGV